MAMTDRYQLRSIARLQHDPSTNEVRPLPADAPGKETEAEIVAAAFNALDCPAIGVMVSDTLHFVRLDFVLYPWHWPQLARNEAAVVAAVKKIVGPWVPVELSRLPLVATLRFALMVRRSA